MKKANLAALLAGITTVLVVGCGKSPVTPSGGVITGNANPPSIPHVPTPPLNPGPIDGVWDRVSTYCNNGGKQRHSMMMKQGSIHIQNTQGTLIYVTKHSGNTSYYPITLTYTAANKFDFVRNETPASAFLPPADVNTPAEPLPGFVPATINSASANYTLEGENLTIDLDVDWLCNNGPSTSQFVQHK